jgi:predicted phosphoribosyltransferase
MRFIDRADAGRQLAARLTEYAARSDVVVLGLPRGGVPVAYEVAEGLSAPLDVFVVRKLGVPGQPELAMGAIAAGGVEVLSRDLIRELGIPTALVERVAARERLELDRRDALYRGGRQAAQVADRTVILVDDGLATGSTMEAALLALRQQRPARLVVAVPVGARDSCDRLRRFADDVVCVRAPEPFNAVGLWYEAFDQTTDDEVAALLAKASSARERRAEIVPDARRSLQASPKDVLTVLRDHAIALEGDPAQCDALIDAIGGDGGV